MNNNSVVLTDVSFAYRGASANALSNVNLEFTHGVTVVLGPNGAGKSTLLSVVAGWLTPDSGTLTMPRRTSDGRMAPVRVAFAPQLSKAVANFTARDQVAYAGWLAGMSRADAWKMAPLALQRVNLDNSAASKASQLSGGQRRRLNIAEALVSQPDVLLLDEPAAGLDPDQRRSLRRVLLGLQKDGMQILLTTHQTDDLELVADDVVVMNRGQVSWAGSTEKFAALAESAGTSGETWAESAYRAAMGAS